MDEPVKKKHVTVRIWRSTRTNLRILAAMRDKEMTETLDELVLQALFGPAATTTAPQRRENDPSEYTPSS